MLHQLLAALRGRANMTLNDVQAGLGVSRATVYAWETPAVRPRPEHLQALLDLYGATDEERLEAWRLRSESKAATGEEAA